MKNIGELFDLRPKEAGGPVECLGMTCFGVSGSWSRKNDGKHREV